MSFKTGAVETLGKLVKNQMSTAAQLTALRLLYNIASTRFLFMIIGIYKRMFEFKIVFVNVLKTYSL
jgi:hypothetical protein